MKVKIVKCSKPTYWYADKIGEIFEVKEPECEFIDSPYKWWVVASYPQRDYYGIKKDDAEVVKEPKYKIGDKIRVIKYVPEHDGGDVGDIGIITTICDISEVFKCTTPSEGNWAYLINGCLWQTEDEIELVTEELPKKYLLYNKTSNKPVGVMKYESAMKCCATAPQCDFILYELGNEFRIQSREIQVPQKQYYVEELEKE